MVLRSFSIVLLIFSQIVPQMRFTCSALNWNCACVGKIVSDLIQRVSFSSKPQQGDSIYSSANGSEVMGDVLSRLHSALSLWTHLVVIRVMQDDPTGINHTHKHRYWIMCMQADTQWTHILLYAPCLHLETEWMPPLHMCMMGMMPEAETSPSLLQASGRVDRQSDDMKKMSFQSSEVNSCTTFRCTNPTQFL